MDNLHTAESYSDRYKSLGVTRKQRMVMFIREKINKIRAWCRNLSEVKYQKHFDKVLKNFDNILQDEASPGRFIDNSKTYKIIK
jgi:hypothetical protein